MLEVADLAVEIQNSEILREVKFSVAAGELVCLVGRNGAGKTTTLRTIMGYIAPRSGIIRLADIDLIGKSTLERASWHRLFAGGQRSVRRTDRCRKYRLADLDTPN